MQFDNLTKFAPMAALDDEELQALYTWVDEIPLSRPKRNIALLCAEVVAHYFPKLVELHNYSSANSMKAKLYNWNTLNTKVFKRLGFQIPESEMRDIVACKPAAVERLLKVMRKHMARYRARGGGDRSTSSHGTPGSMKSVSSVHRTPAEAPAHSAVIGAAPAPGARHAHAGGRGRGAGLDRDMLRREVDAELLMEKEREVQDLKETVELLQLKVNKLEQLVKLKDNKINALTTKLETLTMGS